MLASLGLSVMFACSTNFQQKVNLKGFLESGKTFYSLADWAAHTKRAVGRQKFHGEKHCLAA